MHTIHASFKSVEPCANERHLENAFCVFSSPSFYSQWIANSMIDEALHLKSFRQCALKLPGKKNLSEEEQWHFLLVYCF